MIGVPGATGEIGRRVAARLGASGDGRLAPVLRDDVADALVAMLSEPGHEGITYELTGPESLTRAIAAGEMDVVTDHVARLTAREPVSVHEPPARG